MSLQNLGNIHLTALGAMMLSFLLVGCDDSVAQKRRAARACRQRR